MNHKPPEPEGTPHPSKLGRPVDEWSLAVFSALREWPPAQEGVWTRWEPGYLLLEITSASGCPIERTVLYTSDEEVTVSFGHWENELPEVGTTATDAAMEAANLIERWIGGEFRTLVFWNEARGWCGTVPVTPEEDLTVQLAQSQEWLSHFAPTRAELRSARRDLWQMFHFVDGRLIQV